IARKYFYMNNVIQLLVSMPVLWVISEWCRSWILTGCPWLNLGYSQVDSPLAGLAPITGVYGISWIVAISAAALVYIFIANSKRRLITIVSLVLIWSVPGSIKSIDWTDPKDREIKVTLVQGAIPQEEKWRNDKREYTRNLYLSLSRPHWDNGLIIWPETAIPAFYHQAGFFIEPLITLVQNYEADLLTGIAIRDKDSDKYFNSIISIGKHEEVYNKRHLVPFGEYIPLDKWLRPFFSFLQIPMSDFSAGNMEKPLLTAAGEQIGVSICYEDTFGEEIIDALPEAGILVNISNDAWFGDSIAPHQHLQMARMRSLETGRYLLRATNTGISAIINEKGEIISRSPQFVPHVISEQVRIFEGATPYVTFGNILVLVPAILLLLITLIISARRKLF
ncbi:MAG: apolipoprotein N-acyltransferase, partial [Gammaproteobacteria bacterium]